MQAGSQHITQGGGLTYRTKLVLGVVGLVLFVGSVIVWLAQRSARTTTESLVRSLFREVSGRAVSHSQTFMLRAAPLVESLRRLADGTLALDDTDQFARQLLPFLEANPGLSWISYGDEQGTFTGVFRDQSGRLGINQSRIIDGRTTMTEHEVQPDGSWKSTRTDDDSGYDPRTRPFYLKAKDSHKLVWLPPYVFYNQGIPGVSCAAAVRDAQTKLRGVMSIDFDLNALSEFVSQLRVSPGSTVFLFTADETLLAHPNQRVLTTAGSRGAGSLLTLSEVQDPLVQAIRARDEWTRMRSDRDGAFSFFDVTDGKEEHLASVTTFAIGDDQTWAIGVVAPAKDFLQDVWKAHRHALIAAAIALLIAVLLAVAMARSVSGPVLSLIGFMRRVGSGDLDARANLTGSREFRELSNALNGMIEDLRDRLRLRHSLDVAMHVQQRLLPEKAPKVPGLDVAGHSTYCDETGGDYYDFLEIDEDRPGTILVGLGDVMGHGIAAALVMSGARAVLRDRAQSGSLADIMGRINQLLAADFEGTRFMTMHLSVIDRPARLFRWVSAGHDPALIYDANSGRFVEDDAGDLPLGIDSDSAFVEHTFSPLAPGQVITIGTDGVWEMPNTAGEQFGKERLRTAIRESASLSADRIVEAILARLKEFQGNARQVDDVTFVVVKVE
jgi:phosphoserine phosphatase RsbU/P